MSDIKKTMPFIAVGNDELGKDLGETIKCPRCGADHAVEQSGPSRAYKSTGEVIDGPSGLLQFYRCGEASYLCGINGKAIK